MKKEDRQEVLAMMETFYSSPALWTDGSQEIFERDFSACIGDTPYLEGYVFREDDTVVGYGMIARSFSTEFGKPCVWIEDVYIKDGYRAKGLGTQFLSYVKDTNKDAVIRLELEEDNTAALRAYTKAGYQTVPYLEMIKLD